MPLKVDACNDDPTATSSIDILLPHESFAWLASRGPLHFESRLCPGGWDSVAEWWVEHRSEPWFDPHPAKDLLNAGVKVVPVQLYGDDAELSKGGNALVLTYSSPLCGLPSWKSKMLIAVVPLRLCTPATLETLYACVRWSFDVLLGRRWPERDYWGKVWDDWRSERAGQFLCVHLECAAVVVRLLGHWQWFKETLGLSWYWKTRHVCHLCAAVSHVDKLGDGEGRLYTDFSEEAGWRASRLSHPDFMAFFVDRLAPALLSLPGFHVSMGHPDLMHSFHLGFVGFAISSMLLVLCDRGHFGNFTGNRITRLQEP